MAKSEKMTKSKTEEQRSQKNPNLRNFNQERSDAEKTSSEKKTPFRSDDQRSQKDPTPRNFNQERSDAERTKTEMKTPSRSDDPAQVEKQSNVERQPASKDEESAESKKYSALRNEAPGDLEKKEEEIRKKETPTAANGKMIGISSKSEWEGLTKWDSPVIVDFYKTGCGVCKRIYPKLMEKTNSSAGKLILAGVDIEMEGSKEIAQNMDIDAAPTVILYHKGKVVDKVVGEDEGNLSKLFEKAKQLQN